MKGSIRSRGFQRLTEFKPPQYDASHLRGAQTRHRDGGQAHTDNLDRICRIYRIREVPLKEVQMKKIQMPESVQATKAQQTTNGRILEPLH